MANGPDEWFSYLKANGAERVRLSRGAQNRPDLADRISAAFVGGGGTWLMQVMGRKSDAWMGQWEVWNQNAPEQRIWRVTYWRVAHLKTAPTVLQDLSVAGQEFLSALRDIHAFSTKHNCGWFTDAFSKAIMALTGPSRHGHHKDLAPAGFLGQQASAILDACQSAWVFGGMGSWNDMAFDGDDGKEYDRVSEHLFQTLTQAVSAATNTTAKS